ncbi:transcriptional regulator [sediment metagenome]|uniref:Addiction module antidote protein n=2 Tax=unclassified sequences TaxID=12908 RepID=F8UI80_9ZZZZ|nr:conserved hypothetical protein [uncultured microorganism]
MPAKDYDAYLTKALQDAELAAAYLTAAMKNGNESFLVALRNVTVARGGIGKLAKKTKLGRQATYKMLSKRGNPTIATLSKVLKKLGLGLACEPLSASKRKLSA